MPKRDYLLLAAVLLLAGSLRLGWPGITEFKDDEAQLYTFALDMAEFRTFYLRGIGSSVGLPNSPVSVYLFALPLLVWKSPVAATLFVGLLNTASVGLAYWMSRRYWGTRAAFIAALLYAAAPWAVVYSRKIWAQNLLPLFAAGYALSALLALVEGRSRWLIAHLVLLALIVQIHFSGVALGLVTVVLLSVFRRRVNWRMAFYGVAGAIITAAPFGAYALTQGSGGAEEAGNLLSRPLTFSAEALSMSALVIQGTYLHSLTGAQAFRAFLATIPNFDPLLWLGGLLVVAGAVYALWNAQRALRNTPYAIHTPLVPTEAGLILTLWLLLSILFFIPHLTPVYPHYFIFLFPAPYLLAGIFLDALLARLQAAWQRALLWLLPLAIAGGQVWLLLALFHFVGAQNTPGSFGTPLGRLIQAAEAAKRLGVDDILVVSPGADPGVHTVPAVFDALLRGAPHRFVDGRTTAVFPSQAAAVLLWPGDYPGAKLYWQWGGGKCAVVVSLRAGEGEVCIAVRAGNMPDVPQPREASALLGNGAELLGSGGDASLWQLWWRAPGPMEGENYHVFAHLLDANSERVAQMDMATYAVRDWREGDLVVNYFALGDAGVSVRAGMYTYPSLTPAHVLDAPGNPAGEWIVFPIAP